MQTPPLTSEQVLQRLLAGNHRYTEGQQLYPRQNLAHRLSLLEGQYPFAVILSCSDSRVPSELVFDQGLGDLFIVRTAGHVVNELVLGSIEFAVHALHVPLVMVLGHSQCGAVTSAIAGQGMPGHITHLIETIQPAVTSVQNQEGELLENAIRANSRLSAAYITAASPVIRQAVGEGKLQVVSAFYDLATGRVETLS